MTRLDPAFSRPRPRLSHATTAAILLALGATLSGCGFGGRSVPVSGNGSSALAIVGHARGGQQPVSGSTIQLYRVGTGGNGSAATPMLTQNVISDANGAFDITGDYSCQNSTDQVYLTATGGNPGLAPGTVNAALTLVVALGDCGLLPSVQQVSVNEITTAAAAWALHPFATSATQIGATASNAAGLRNAMGTAMMLADSSMGTAPAAQLPVNAQTETAKLITLADILAACVNSDGTGPCTSLFTDAAHPGSTTPADTFSAALAIVAWPGHHVTTLYNHLPAQLAFPGALPVAPHDWTMTLAFSGGGLNLPSAVSVDAAGNAWTIGGAGTLSGFSPQGVPVAAMGYTGGSLYSSYGLAIDASGNLWIANQQTGSTSTPDTGSAVEVTAAGALMSGAGGFTGNSLNEPVAAAADVSGNVWFANYGSATLSLFGPGGVPMTSAGGFGQGSLSHPLALALDAYGAAWVTSADTPTLTRISAAGNLLAQISCCAAANALAIDSAGNLWAASTANQQLTGLTPGGTIVQTLTLDSPGMLSVDGGDHLWIPEGASGTLSEVAGTNAGPTPGKLLSPAGGLGLDANLMSPYGAAADASGNVWVSSFGNNTLVKFVGLAVPVKTPLTGLPQVP